MDLKDYSFHDSTILEVKEITSEQAIEFLIDFPVNWEKNIFESHVLRFNNVIFYKIEEILFSGRPTILDVEASEEKNKTQKVAIITTNAGSREMHYTTCEFNKA